MRTALFDYFISALLMSLAWSLRGQFGHLKGAMIPGAVAALTLAVLNPGKMWRRNFGWLVMMSALGFSLGGHLSYGSLVESIASASQLSSLAIPLLEVFVLGAVWGGLGMTFLGFASSERSPRPQDAVLIAVLGFLWVVPLGLLNLEQYDLALLGGGLALAHFYNLAVKKSKAVLVFGSAGVWGFGTGFLLSVFLLHMGNRGLLPGPWPWWALRDQIFGAIGGLAVAWSARRVVKLDLSPCQEMITLSMQQYGFVFFASIIPAVNAFNVVHHWITKPPMLPSGLVLGLAALIFAPLVAAFVLLAGASGDSFFEPRLNRGLFLSSLLFLWSLSVLAIAKETLPQGWHRWEPGFTLFLIYSLALSPLLYFKFKAV